jgi:hypothetical protein
MRPAYPARLRGVVVPIGPGVGESVYRRWESFAVAATTAARDPARRPLISPVRNHAGTVNLVRLSAAGMIGGLISVGEGVDGRRCAVG